MNYSISLFTFAIFIFIFTLESSEAQSPSTATQSKANIEVIQFHSEHRCRTCNTIEVLARKALEKNSNIPFRLINVDERENDKIAKEFEAAGTALFLYHPSTGKKKELTDFAFMNAGNEKKFTSQLKEEIEIFKRGL